MVHGLHHLTAIAGDAQENLDFYTGALGLRLVKTTVNFDDPGTYHLYYGDGAGTPGTILTFFPYGRALPGNRGAGEASAVTLLVPEGSLSFWRDRLPGAVERGGGLSAKDPDGMELRLVEAPETVAVPWPGMPVPSERAIVRMAGVELTPLPAPSAGRGTEAFLTDRLGFSQRGSRFTSGDSFVDVVDLGPAAPRLRQSAGTIHHVAFRTEDGATQREALKTLAAAGVPASDVRDRDYFTSIYFREPGGVLFEIATDGPGFAADEPFETLGRALKLPSGIEPHRARIEATLPRLRLP